MIVERWFFSIDCDSHNVGYATASQLVLFVSMLRRDGCALPQFAFKNVIVVGLCTTQTKVHPKYVTAYSCAFEEGMQRWMSREVWNRQKIASKKYSVQPQDQNS